eukprot:358229-Chlamydomonas_euryale.AAC.13
MPTCTGSPAWAGSRTAQMCAAAGVPQLKHILNTARLTRLGHATRMPDESVVKQLVVCLRAGGIGWHGWQATLHVGGWGFSGSARGSHILVGGGVGLVWRGSGPCAMACLL